MTSRPRNIAQKPPLPIYPVHCHDLSPTAKKWCPLTAVAVYNLVQFPGFEGQNFYHYNNHPIRWIQVTGVIVAVEQFKNNRMVYTLDDSSGATIECTCVIEAAPLAPPDHNPNLSSSSKLPITTSTKISTDGVVLTHVDVGSVVKFKGSIGTYWDKRHLQIKKMWEIRDTNEEVKAWAERERFLTDVLGEVWVVREEDEKKCLEAAETERKVLQYEAKRKARGERQQNQMQKDNGKKKETQERRTQGKNKKSMLLMAATRRWAGKLDALGI